MGRYKIPTPVKDSKEDIQKCLHCELNDCCNCLSPENKLSGMYERRLKEQKERSDNSYIYSFDSVDYDILDAYPECSTLTDIARTINQPFRSVQYRLYKKMHLPSPAGHTLMEKKRIVELCRIR